MKYVFLISILVCSCNFALSEDKNSDPDYRRQIINQGDQLSSENKYTEAAKYYYYGVKNWVKGDQVDDLARICQRLFSVFFRANVHKEQEDKLGNCSETLLDELYGRVDRPSIPLVKVAPRIPMRAWTKGASGHVVVDYYVDKKGRAKDIKIIESTHRFYNKPCVRAAKKFLYLPKIHEGVAVKSERVTNRFTFNVPKREKNN